MDITQLKPQKVWEFFQLVSSVPHGSGNERALAELLRDRASASGLESHIDAAGNLLIRRRASAGMENCRRIILQAHLDMVTVAGDESFDFINTPVTPVFDNGYVRACNTTLGADDGIGVAMALAVLFDRDLVCGEMTGLFTVAEEIGLNGAAAVSPDALQGDFLINLDNCEEASFCIGCAGGARQEFVFDPVWEDAPAAAEAVQIHLYGLEGGHSGCCIHLDRGNALKLLAGFIDQHPELRLNSFSGGSVDNAIPDEAWATGFFTGSDVETLQQSALFYLQTVSGEFNAPETLTVEVKRAVSPVLKVWQAAFQQDFISALTLVPDGVIEYDEVTDIVKTSSNCAASFVRDGKLVVRTSQRSMDDECRENISNILQLHFENFGASSSIGNIYPGWLPRRSSELVNSAVSLWESRYGSAAVSAIHAGLECGWFAKKNPALQLLSIGPEAIDIHTPQERVSVASVERCFSYLLELISALR